MGNPPTRARGTGSQRVDNEQPVPLPQRTLPVTRAGFKTLDNHYLQLAFECEGGGGGGRRVGRTKETTSGSHLDAREVVVGDGLKERKKPPPARVWTRGRWQLREVGWKNENDHLRLTLGCEGGGGGGSCVETMKRTTFGSRLDARVVVVVAAWV